MTLDEFATAMGRQAAATLAQIAADLKARGASDEEIAGSLEALAAEWTKALGEGLATFKAELVGAGDG